MTSTAYATISEDGAWTRITGEENINNYLVLDGKNIVAGTMNTSADETDFSKVEASDLVISTSASIGKFYIGAQYADNTTEGKYATVKIVGDSDLTVGQNIAIRESGKLYISDGSSVTIARDKDAVIQGLVSVDGEGSVFETKSSGLRIYKANGEISVTNGGKVILGSYNASYPCVGAEGREGGKITMDKGILEAKGNLLVHANGVVNMTNNSTLSVAGTLTNNSGMINIANGSFVEVAGDLLLNGKSFSDTVLTIDYTSTLKVGGTINFGDFATLGGIAVDTSNYSDGKTYKVVDSNGFSGVATCISGNVLEFNNDFYVTEQNTSTLHVGTGFANASTGDIVDDKIVGYNAFGTFTGVVDAVIASETTSVVKVHGDVTEVLTNDKELIINSDLTITADSSSKISLSNSGTSYDLVLNGNSNNDVREKLTIGENVTLEVADRVIWAGYYGNNVDIQVDGTLKGGYQLWIGADTTVGNTGKLVSAGEAFVLRRGATVTVNGTATLGASEADRTCQIDANYFSLLAGNIVVNNTLVNCGELWVNNTGSFAGEGNVHVKLNNTIWNTAGTLKLSSTHADGAILELTDGSVMNIAGNGSVIEKGSKVIVKDSVFSSGSLTNNGAFEVYGESTLNIGVLSETEVNIYHGATIKDSTVGGHILVLGDVVFQGKNTFAMLEDFGDAYSDESANWTVERGASVFLTEKARYGLGYGDKATILGNITNALTARESLTEGDISFFTHGLVAMSTWNVESSFTVNDAYVIIGSNNSFGNSSNTKHTGTYAFYFENSVLDASRITFYEALSTTTFTFKDCDVKLGTFMTRDKDSVFTLDNTKLLSTTTTNGTDEGNYNAGTLNVINGSELTYSALLSNEVGGTINVVDSTLTVLPGIKNDSKIVVSNSTLRAGNIVNNGTIYVEGDGVTSWDSDVTGSGAIYVGKDNVTGADNLGSTMKIVGDKSISGSKLYVDDGAVLKIEEGNTLSFFGVPSSDDYQFLVIGGNLDVAGDLSVDGCSIRFSRAKNTTISGTANFGGQTCIYGSNVTVTGELNITHGQNKGDSLIIGYSNASSIGNIDTTANLVVSGEGAKVTVNGGDWKSAAVTKIYTDENGKVGTLTVENGAAFETDGSIESSGIINVDNGSLSVAGTITNNYWLLVQNGGSLSANKIVNNYSFDIYNSTLANQTISGNGYVYAENAQFNNVSVSGNTVYMMGTNVNGGSFGNVYSGYGVVDGEWATAANAKSVISGNVTSGDWYNYGQLTVSEGATMKVGYYGDTASGSTTVNGTVEATTYRSYNGTVGANGKIVAGYVHLYGNANSQKHYEIAGTVTAKENLLIGFDSIYQGEWHIGGANTVVMVSGENAKLEALSDATIHADDAGKKATLNVLNGGKVIVEGTLTNNGVINVNGGTLTAVTIVNNGSITLNSAIFNVTNLTGTGSLTMLGDSRVTDGSEGSLGVEIDSIVVTTESNSVALSASAGTIVFGGVQEVTESANTEITLEANQGVVIAWHFAVSGIEENQSVTVETNIGAGFSTSEIKIFHKEDDASEWTNANVSDVAYDKETGKLSFKANSFSSYAVAVPEPSMFGLFAGLGALLLVGTRRRRK